MTWPVQPVLLTTDLLLWVIVAAATALLWRAGSTPRLAAAFPVEETDDLLLVTSGGQMIRTRMDQVRIVGRSSQGVTIFRTGKDEKVVSVERLPESGGSDEADVASEEGGEAEA